MRENNRGIWGWRQIVRQDYSQKGNEIIGKGVISSYS